MIDLSHVPQDEKIDYIRTVLPALNVMRRRTGLPHRILLDEAHYFLHNTGAHRLLDLETSGYTVVTYWASRLPKDLLAATEVMLVTCESNPAEIDGYSSAARRASSARGHGPMVCPGSSGQRSGGGPAGDGGVGRRVEDVHDWPASHAARQASPEVCGRTGDREPRLSFRSQGAGTHRARTLQQFVAVLEQALPGACDGHLRRADFSRWMAEVFGDFALAEELGDLERRYGTGQEVDTLLELVGAIRARSDLTDDEEADQGL